MLLEGRREGEQQCGKAQGSWGAPRVVLFAGLMSANLRVVEVQCLWTTLSEHPSWLGIPHQVWGRSRPGGGREWDLFLVVICEDTGRVSRAGNPLTGEHKQALRSLAHGDMELCDPSAAEHSSSPGGMARHSRGGQCQCQECRS